MLKMIIVAICAAAGAAGMWLWSKQTADMMNLASPGTVGQFDHDRWVSIGLAALVAGTLGWFVGLIVERRVR